MSVLVFLHMKRRATLNHRSGENKVSASEQLHRLKVRALHEACQSLEAHPGPFVFQASCFMFCAAHSRAPVRLSRALVYQQHIGQHRTPQVHSKRGSRLRRSHIRQNVASSTGVTAASASMAATAPPPPALNLQQRAEQLGIELVPLHENFGVQVKGLDLSQPLTEAQQSLLLDAWRQHDLLLFCGQQLTPADEQRLLLLFPHDSEAIKEERFCNSFFNIRIPSHPLVSIFASRPWSSREHVARSGT